MTDNADGRTTTSTKANFAFRKSFLKVCLISHGSDASCNGLPDTVSIMIFESDDFEALDLVYIGATVACAAIFYFVMKYIDDEDDENSRQRNRRRRL